MRMVFLAAAAAIAGLSGCGRDHDDTSASVSVASDGETTTTTTRAPPGAAATTGTSSVDLKLPGGFEARVKGPHGFSATKFDIDGVGLYPGAKIGGISVNVDASGGGRDSSHVDMRFTARSDPAAVADWYVQQFTAKSLPVSRTGDTLKGRTKDGDQFVIAAAPLAGGGTAGTVTIIGS